MSITFSTDPKKVIKLIFEIPCELLFYYFAPPFAKLGSGRGHRDSDEGMCAFPFKGVDFLINGSEGRVRSRGRVCRVELGLRGEVRGKETRGLGPEPGLTVPLHSFQT